jgi:protein-S-isoprenylcysteine O-methyltransferase Ste14
VKDRTRHAVASASNRQFALWGNVAGLIFLGLLVFSFVVPQPGSLILQVVLFAVAAYGMRLVWVFMRSRQDF